MICERIRTIFTRLINACWSIIKYGLLLGGLAILAAVFGSWYFQNTINDKIRASVEETIAEGYPHLSVNVQSVQRIEGKGILVRGLSLTEKEASGPQTELAYFQEVLLGCRAQLQELITKKPNITHIVLRRPTLRGTRRADGTWSLEKLFPLPEFGGTAQAMRIEQGELILFDPLKNPSGILKVSDVNFLLKFSSQKDPSGNIEKWTAFKGSLLGEHFGRGEIEGSVGAETKRWQLSGRFDDATLSPELQQDLPGDLAEHLAPIRQLRGHLGLKFQINHDPKQPQPLRFAAVGAFTQGRLEDPRLPYPLSDIQAQIRVDQQGIRIEKATARNGKTLLTLESQIDGYGPTPHLHVQGSAKHLAIDKEIANVLPPEWKKHWNRYLPTGEVNAAFQLRYDETGWHPQCDIECISLAFTHYKFPYRLEEATGSIRLKDDALALQLTARAGARPVEILGQIHNPGPHGVGEIIVKTESLAIDEKLIGATPGKIQNVITSFAPQGTVDVFFRAVRDIPSSPWIPHYVIDLNEISVRYEKFSYPLQKVRGRLTGVGKKWSYQNLVGQNDTGLVTANGESLPTDAGIQLNLQITGQQIVLDDEIAERTARQYASTVDTTAPQRNNRHTDSTTIRI